MPGVSVISGAIVGDGVALDERTSQTTSRGEREVMKDEPRVDSELNEHRLSDEA